VVHLGPDFTIQSATTGLQVLLLRAPTAAGMQGTCFVDVVAEADRERFREHVGAAPPDEDGAEGLGGSLHLHMRDAVGTAVSVQIFHSLFLDLDDRLCHIIGICEDPEQAWRAPAQLVASMQALPPAPVERQAASNAAGVSNDTNSAISENEERKHIDMGIWVDTISPTLQLERATAGFTALTLPSGPCPELLPWIARSQRKRFMVFLQTCGGIQTYGQEDGEVDPAPLVFKGLRLQPPHLERFKITIAVTAEFVPQAAGGGSGAASSAEPDGSSEDDPSVVKLVLRDPVWQQGAKPEKRRAWRGTAASVASRSLAAPTPAAQGIVTGQICSL